jgi:hypothetical protein
VPAAAAAIRRAITGMKQPELKVCRFESEGAIKSFATASLA